MNQPGRLHALDNLRAVLMWLGIVIHVAIHHITTNSPLPWRDPVSSPFADLLVAFIHTFRMPAFFILAGFLVAMMVAGRGVGGMLRNRLRRLALPFVIFWPVLFFATGLLVIMYVHMMVRGTIGFDVRLLAKPAAGKAGINTMHLWFLYYLFLFSVVTACLVPLRDKLPGQFRQAAAAVRMLTSNWWGVLVATMPLALIGSFYPYGMVQPSGSFIPHAGEFLHYGLYFLFGWILHGQQERLLAHLEKNCWKYCAAGSVVFLIALKLFRVYALNPLEFAHFGFILAYVYNCSSWLYSLSILGIFLRYLPRQNGFLLYLSESSYWVFLVHMLGTIGFGILLCNAPLGVLSKMGINIALTTLACLLSYHFLVRNTVVGVLLNGRRVSATRGPAAALPA
jgi:glucan biosynthesis protein C